MACSRALRAKLPFGPSMQPSSPFPARGPRNEAAGLAFAPKPSQEKPMPFDLLEDRRRCFIPIRDERGEPTAKRRPIFISINRISFLCYGDEIVFSKNLRAI